MMRDSHKLFLQAFMSRGLLDAKEVKTLFKLVCEKFSGKLSIAIFISPCITSETTKGIVTKLPTYICLGL